MQTIERWAQPPDPTPDPDPTGMPALMGLTCLTTETAVARFFGVGQSTVNDWTNGKRGMSAARIWFATRLLAFHIEEAKDMLNMPQFSAQQKMVWRAKIRTAESWLTEQQGVNELLPAEAKIEGLALYEARQAAYQPLTDRKRRVKARKNGTRTPQLGGNEGAGSENMTTTPRKGGRRVRA